MVHFSGYAVSGVRNQSHFLYSDFIQIRALFFAFTISLEVIFFAVNLSGSPVTSQKAGKITGTLSRGGGRG